MKKIYSLLLALLSISLIANAQSQLGEIRGKIIDGKTKKPMDFVSVSVFLNGVLKATAITDEDGSYIVKTLQPGDYDVKVSNIGYRPAVVKNVEVISDKISFQNISMESNEGGKVLDEIVVERKKPLVDPEGKGGGTVTSKEIMALPNRNGNNIANTIAGVESRGGGTPNIRGARAEGTAYYIDGIRVNGSLNIPIGAIDQIQVITGGTPAQYGDFVGGAISYSTKSPTRQFQRYFEYRTSSPFTGTLDNTQLNELNMMFSGPLKILNKNKGDKERVLWGFLIAGTASYIRDGNPPSVDIYKVKDNVLRQLQANPLSRNASGTFVNSGEYLTMNDLEKTPYRLNAASQLFSVSGSFNYAPTNNINVKIGYQLFYNKYRTPASYGYTLMDYDNNLLVTTSTVRPYIQYTQSFKKKNDEEAKKALISNAYYTVRLSYENYYYQQENADFGQNVFNYGYIGKFNEYTATSYAPVAKTFRQQGQQPDKYSYFNTKTNKMDTLVLTNYTKQISMTDQFDTLITFQQANINVLKGNYTREVMDYNNSINSPVTNYGNITTQQGLLNGYEPLGVYSNMWYPSGTSQTGYVKQMRETYALYVMSEASVGTNPKTRHDLQFGINYEQQIQRGYSLSATQLWQLMPQLVNQQFAGNDSSRVIVGFNSNGVFNDTVRFHPLIDPTKQSTFDMNLRNQLISSGATDIYGRPITNESRLNVNMFNPNTYSLKMFSATDLLNNGNSYVGYYGYDYIGNIVSGKQGIDKFLNDQNRYIGAFQPIYFASWLQDKFVFKDLIVRLGVRMEYFNANQIVLKDPYSMLPIYTAGDVRRGTSQLMQQLAAEIPSNVNDATKVYIDNEAQEPNKTNISGFRNGNDWYDSKGNPVTDPKTLYLNSVAEGAKISHNTPFLVDQTQYALKQPNASSFTDYVPQIKFLPRVWFSFPISTTAQFFGTYDVLTQRPTQGLNIANISDYYYLINRSTGVIGNPDLKLSEVTDYKIGFKQQIGDNSSLGIEASYREFRNLLQQYRYIQAFPVDYTTYSNIDFSTTKNIVVEYELRDAGNVHVQANYTLQFAEGTGSNANSSANLVNTGVGQQRNIFPLDIDTRHILKGIFDYHYKSGKLYDGPIVNGKKILEQAGFNFIFNYSSGRPYTPANEAITTTQDGVARSQTNKGTINSASLPSQFYLDLNIDKFFSMRTQSLEGKTKFYSLRIYLEITNLFDAANVLGVYRYTGSAYDDGFLNSPNATSQIQKATNAQSFIDLYNTKMVNPGNFAFPRMTRMGISLAF